MAYALTPRQQDLARFIAGYHEAHDGISPTRRDMCAALGLASRGGVQRLIYGLVERRVLRILPGRARAVEVIAPIALPRTAAGEPLIFIRKDQVDG